MLNSLGSVEDKEQKQSKARLFDHISDTSLETTALDISGELMNFISRFALDLLKALLKALK